MRVGRSLTPHARDLECRMPETEGQKKRQGGSSALPVGPGVMRECYFRNCTVGAAPPHVPPLVLWSLVASARMVPLSQEASAVLTSAIIPEEGWPALQLLSSAATACWKSLASEAQRLLPPPELRAASNVRFGQVGLHAPCVHTSKTCEPVGE